MLRIARAKSLFFDRQAVLAAVNKAERQTLSRFGAFVRQDARGRIRKRKRASRPGEPPTDQTGLLKRHIYFVFDPDSRSVVIGPALLNRGTGAPAILEYGTLAAPPRRASRTPATVAPRPYMGPAFAKERAKLPDLWRNSVK